MRKKAKKARRPIRFFAKKAEITIIWLWADPWADCQHGVRCASSATVGKDLVQQPGVGWVLELVEEEEWTGSQLVVA